MKVASLVLLLSAAAAGKENGWSALETPETYVNYPPEVQEKVDSQDVTFRADGFLLPTLRAFQAFPEYGRLNVWPLLKAMNTRLSPVLWAHVHYYLDEGIEFGCRTADGQPVTTAHCHRHCTNGGRYCAPQRAEEDLPEGREGHDVVKEIVRRLCMDDIYHSKDPRFIAYLEEFDAQDCFEQEQVRSCSIEAMEKVGMHFSQIEPCLQEQSYEQDVPLTILDRNARHLDEPLDGEYYIDDLPMVTIEGEPTFWKELTASFIFRSYCEAFPKENVPVACEICAGCEDVRTCLWTLTCDGKPAIPGLDANDPSRVDDQAYTTTASSNLQENPERGGAGGIIFLVIFVLLSVVGLLMAVVYKTHLRNKDFHRKTQALQDAITSDRDQNSSDATADDEEEDENSVYRLRAQQLLSEVALGKYGIYNGEKLMAQRQQESTPIC